MITNMIDITQKELEQKVRHYAKLLGVDHRLTSVHINELMPEDNARCWTIFNDYSKNRIELATHEPNTIIHELLHIVFANTVNMMHKIDNETLREIFLMIHEQEIQAFSVILENILPKHSQK